jgi:hypothetical protein
MAAHPMSDKLLKSRVGLWRKCKGVVSDMAREAGINSETMRHQVREAKRRGFIPGGPATGGMVETIRLDEKERVKLRDEIGRLRRELTKAHRHALSTEHVREAIFGLAEMHPTAPDWPATARISKGGPGIPQTLWSDWHWGEVVKRDQVGGVNAFNLTIAAQRARRLVETIIDLAFNHQVNPQYPGIVVALGGDMITGEIHPELTETNEAPIPPTLMDLLEALIWCFDRLLEKFPRIFVPCVVGNHGRMTIKPRAKNVVHTSFEWMLYTMLERHYRHDKRIRFLVSDDIHAHYRVAGCRVLLTHGDRNGVKGGDGFIGPIGPIIRGRGKVALAEVQVGRDFDLLIEGHWHYYLAHTEAGLIVNGALIGYSEYARNMLSVPFQRPIQAMWYTHPEIGITKAEPIYLEQLPKRARCQQRVCQRVQRRRRLAFSYIPERLNARCNRAGDGAPWRLDADVYWPSDLAARSAAGRHRHRATSRMGAVAPVPVCRGHCVRFSCRWREHSRAGEPAPCRARSPLWPACCTTPAEAYRRRPAAADQAQHAGLLRDRGCAPRRHRRALRSRDADPGRGASHRQCHPRRREDAGYGEGAGRLAPAGAAARRRDRALGSAARA